ncbi:hypothetical protein DEAC_c42010 [Desulfosporosinus acididurans]|uniref:Uncharacterized protein n=1 Tax=Desulfosporosinus acididurans TaxID=476652 RepID=A0A0J1FK82_9FIRM|nr:hypothetical protein [Desulfosporosinus acididurans]KLU63889.1 hypothetical protein DEAC_c42010 [Desulfosporosinus acididurans]
MVKQIIINGFNSVEKKDVEAPKINKVQVKKLKGTKDGKRLLIESYKALRFTVKPIGSDEEATEIKEENIAKLFPNEFAKFNIKITTTFGEAKGKKGNVMTKEAILYFPAAMLKKFQIDLYFRKKMDLYHYDMTATPEKWETTEDEKMKEITEETKEEVTPRRRKSKKEA